MKIFTDNIKKYCLELGFAKVGIANAVKLSQEENYLRKWLDLGYQATMTWMDRTTDRRIDPKLVFPEVRSIVVVALNYYTPHAHSNQPDTGKISRYAWGDDYHDVITEKLSKLLEWVKERNPKADGKICIDAQPAMDKAWAVRAGLGWIGKHSNLITREYGSWVFLGELFLNIDLEPEETQVPDYCGSCTACIDACPTQAIVQSYVVDARRCISFATIESKTDDENFPTDGWIFGCDICQDVCPWSRFSKQTEENRFQPRDGLVSPSLEELKNLNEDEFNSNFAGSPIKRTKLRGLKRNILSVEKQQIKKKQSND